jgi:hypothetical protein
MPIHKPNPKGSALPLCFSPDAKTANQCSHFAVWEIPLAALVLTHPEIQLFHPAAVRSRLYDFRHLFTIA